MSIYWRNGNFMDSRDFSIAAMDRGLTHGLGLFETILVVDGKPVFLDAHLNRLRRGCSRLRWDPSMAAPREIMVELIRANNLAHGRARIRLAITGGGGSLRDLSLGSDHLIWMTTAQVDPGPPTVSANLSPWPRNEHSPLAGLKCASYAENLIALDHARRMGFEETLFTNTKGLLCEAATSNVFFVRGDTLITPPLSSGCLQGITRSAIICFATQLGIKCCESDTTPEDLMIAEEVFLTSSLRGVTSVVQLEDKQYHVGPVTTRLRQAWGNQVAAESI